MPRTGRPEIEIDETQLEKLAMLHCTQAEMAAWFGCSIDTIKSRLKRNGFSAAIEKGLGRGKISLRRHQWRLAEAGNATMLIWLGKQYLGQTDKTEVSGPGGSPVQHEHIYTGAVEKLEGAISGLATRLRETSRN